MTLSDLIKRFIQQQRAILEGQAIIIEQNEQILLWTQSQPCPPPCGATQLVVYFTQSGDPITMPTPTSFLSSKGPITAHVFEADAAGNILGAELPATAYDLVISAGSGTPESFVGNVMTPTSGSDVSSMTVTATENSTGPNPGFTGASPLALTDAAVGLAIQFSQL